MMKNMYWSSLDVAVNLVRFLNRIEFSRDIFENILVLFLFPKLPRATRVGTSCCSTHDDGSIAATTEHTDMQQILKVHYVGNKATLPCRP